jgi:hypothetical protein
MSGQQVFASALLDPDLACPAGIKTWNGSDPALRFAVYRNNVLVSLVDALADSFPVVQELVGEEFFRAMASVYIRAHPPRSRLLLHCGDVFPDFIASFPPAASVPYLADVASLEIARTRAYHAADRAPLDDALLRLALADPDLLLKLRLQFHPSVFLIRSKFAVFSLWAAHQGSLSISDVDPAQAQSALVFRDGLDIQVLALSAGTAVFTAALLSGDLLIAAAAEATNLEPVFDLASTMARFLRFQLICSITTGEKK